MEIDALQLNLYMDSVYVKELLSVKWICESGLVENIELVVEEYRQSRQLLVRKKRQMQEMASERSVLLHIRDLSKRSNLASVPHLFSPFVCVFWVHLQWGKAQCPNSSVNSTNSITSLWKSPSHNWWASHNTFETFGICASQGWLIFSRMLQWTILMRMKRMTTLLRRPGCCLVASEKVETQVNATHY